MRSLPETVTGLIKELSRSYPEKCPDHKDDDRKIWMYAGKRELVRQLEMRLADSEEGGLNG